MRAPGDAIVLVGLESAGKSAVFRCLTGAIGDELNVRGSTVRCRRAANDAGATVVDTPGLRLDADTEAARLALASMGAADRVVVVARAIDGRWGVDATLRRVRPSLGRRPIAVVLTFADRAREANALAAELAAELRAATAAIDARRGGRPARRMIEGALARAAPLRRRLPLASAAAIARPRRPRWMIGLALLAVAAMFGIPVWAAYELSLRLQPVSDALVVRPVVTAVAAAGWPAPLHDVLVGPFGLLTLGVYSLVWALPLIALLGAAVAIVDDAGVKDRVVDALDPAARWFGLQGRDLLPILGGFGCKTIAVQQTRGCSACTREACAAILAYGASCSYQLGASLSVFAAAGRPADALVLVLVVFAVGLVHARLWYGRRAPRPFEVISRDAVVQLPSARAVAWRMAATTKQFLTQALPVFLAVCVAGALLATSGALHALTCAVAPALALFDLPPDAAPAAVTSVIRKDGLLLAHADGGALLARLGAAQVFTLVYLAATATACLVTVWTAWRELGRRTALRLAGAQLLTSLVSAYAIARIAALDL